MRTVRKPDDSICHSSKRTKRRRPSSRDDAAALRLRRWTAALVETNWEGKAVGKWIRKEPPPRTRVPAELENHVYRSASGREKWPSGGKPHNPSPTRDRSCCAHRPLEDKEPVAFHPVAYTGQGPQLFARLEQAACARNRCKRRQSRTYCAAEDLTCLSLSSSLKLPAKGVATFSLEGNATSSLTKKSYSDALTAKLHHEAAVTFEPAAP